MKKYQDISVIVPVYNEENGVSESIAAIAKAIEDFQASEIVIVNDGSSDATAERIKALPYPNITVINHVENLGYGRSLLDGIVAAKYDCILIIDGDGSYPAVDIKRLYEFYPQYDMIVGARTGSEYRKGLFKRPARTLFSLLVQYTVGTRVPDVNSGFRIFKKHIMMKYKDSLCTGFSFTTTLTLNFFIDHYYVKYIPIDYFKREGKSKVRHFRDTLRAAQIIIQAILYSNPIKLFLLVAILNAAAGLGLAVLNYFFFRGIFLSLFSSLLVASFIPVFCMGLVAEQLRYWGNLNKH